MQTKPGYIPKEDIIRELKEIEDNLNELERRGVELELRLRKKEEGEIKALRKKKIRLYKGRVKRTSVLLPECVGCFFLTEGDDDTVMDELMVEWFTLIKNKQVAMRRESELVYMQVLTHTHTHTL